MAGETKSPTRVTQLIESCSDSHAEIAEKLGVDKSLVTRWRNGERKPNAAHMAKLERLYGSANVARPLPPPPALDDEDEPEDVGADLAEDDAFDSDEANSVRLNRFIRNGIRELQLDKQLSGVKKAEALKKLVDAQVALDRSTGENALTLSRIVGHPEFKRCVKIITEALAAHPAALRDVGDALRQVGG